MRITRVNDIDFYKSDPCVVICAVVIIFLWIIFMTEECKEQCLRRVEH